MVLESRPLGHRWRSSNFFILSVVILALFCETFLYSFPVPILSYMIEARLHIDPSQTQNITTALLSLHGLIALISAPVIAHFADKSPKRKLPFLISLAGCFIGTTLLSLTPSVPALFAGRILQGIAGSATWIVGSATMTDHVEVANLGKLYGLSMSFVSAGVVAGPAIAGTVLELAGYWPAWSVALGLLALDIIMRFVMIEAPKASSTDRKSSATHQSDNAVSGTETSALLGHDDSTDQPDPLDFIPETNEGHTPEGSFYWIMLSDPRVISGISSTILSSSILASFDTTLTLHLRTIYLLGIFSRMASGSGWIALSHCHRLVSFAPIMWLLGVPGSGKLLFGSKINGEALFIFGVIAFGVVTPLVRGAGYLQLSIVLNELQAKDPEIFGRHGGSNRVFALQDIALSLGLMIGPLISGFLSQVVGYYWMSCTLGRCAVLLLCSVC
ncbi:hypothetical protein N7454_005639 [Penicillium verhagenii]|nr:hypothetical protein N7454_005639 [Penicillium verhagenii]